MTEYDCHLSVSRTFLPVTSCQTFQIQAKKIFRDDVGRVRWIIAEDGQWYGLTYRLLDKDWQVESLIESFRIWRTTDNYHFRSRELNGKSTLGNDCDSRLYFKGKICVEQHSGKISLQIDKSGYELYS